MQFLRWKDVTNSQNFHLASFSFPFLRTYCSSLTRCTNFSCSMSDLTFLAGKCNWPHKVQSDYTCKTTRIDRSALRGVRNVLLSTSDTGCRNFWRVLWVLWISIPVWMLAARTSPSKRAKFPFHPNAMSGASPSVPSTFGAGTSSGESRPVWDNLSGSMFQMFWIQLSSGETFMGAPISSNPNFGVSAASRASRHPRWRQSVWLRKNCIKLVSGVHNCCSMKCILYIFENSIVTIWMHVDISLGGDFLGVVSDPKLQRAAYLVCKFASFVYCVSIWQLLFVNNPGAQRTRPDFSWILTLMTSWCLVNSCRLVLSPLWLFLVPFRYCFLMAGIESSSVSGKNHKAMVCKSKRGLQCRCPNVCWFWATV